MKTGASVDSILWFLDDFGKRLARIEEQNSRLEQTSQNVISQLNEIRSNSQEAKQIRTASKQPPTQIEKDNRSIWKRKEVLGQRFFAMNELLRTRNRKELILAARMLQNDRRLVKIDRIARRNRDALICWYCETCPDILNNEIILLDILNKYRDAISNGTLSSVPTSILSFPLASSRDSTVFHLSDEPVEEIGFESEPFVESDE
jgi:hypothetical protein